MFCALAESFIFLFALTNIIKHFLRCCWGLGFCLSLVIALRNANKHFWRRCQGSNWRKDSNNDLDVC